MQYSDQARFLTVIPGLTHASDLLGVWQIMPLQRPLDSGATQHDATVWYVDLPDDRQAAATCLTRRAVLLETEQRALPIAGQRLNAFVHNTRQAAANLPTGFALPEYALSQPERELAAWLQAMHGQESFFPGEHLTEGWQETARRAWAFIDQVRLSLACYARVETSSGGKRIGRTSVGWLGDVDTIWFAGLDSELIAMHQRALTLALDSRAAWGQTVLHIVVGATRLSALLAVPGGLFLAVPAAWKFIRQLLVDLGQVQASTEV
jgi:hypothetical protein